MLDLWGQQWAILKDYTRLHSAITSVLIALSLAALAWRAWADVTSRHRVEEYTAILEKLLHIITKIVTFKTIRFQTKLRELKPTTNPFDHITQPEDQIRYICTEAQDFFAELIERKPEEVDISVMRYDPYKQKWYFVAITTGPRRHTDPARLMKEHSIAHHCVNGRTELFVADKRSAEREKTYFMSEKDKHFKCIGSAFCSFLWVATTPEGTDDREANQFVVSFVTYGAQVCESFDHQAEECIKPLFREFVKRIELECTLLVLKKWRENHQKENKKNRKTRKGGGDHAEDYAS